MKRFYEENYGSPALVELWADFIDWKKRRKGEQGFLVKRLKKHQCLKILDASLGDGCDSIYLLKQNFRVISNEIDSLFTKKARLNSQKESVRLKITNYNWLEIDKKFSKNSFDAIILLGNSLTYLFSKKDRLRTLSAFHNILRKGGVLLVDERNYGYILSHKREIKRGKFRYSGKYVYCGSKVHAKPVEIQKNKIVMEYEHQNGKKGFLTLYPFKKGELKALLKETGFKKVTRHSDYKKGYSNKADFYQYEAVK
ncbi:MAG TPA: class I SAM-dependent methyltransferase [Candidatus Norongarragalinales archaeon]|nr:class I SAM-dependent methyltransferase [Candidatus Norongarragalinales archaeon]